MLLGFVNILFAIKPSLASPPTDDSCLSNPYYDRCHMVAFLTPSDVRVLVGILFPFLMYSFNHLFQYRVLNSYFIQWVGIYCCHCLFQCSECPRFGDKEPLQAGSCVLLPCPHQSSMTSLSFDTIRCSRLVLYWFCLSWRTRHFSKEPFFLFSGEWCLETKF